MYQEYLTVTPLHHDTLLAQHSEATSAIRHVVTNLTVSTCIHFTLGLTVPPDSAPPGLFCSKLRLDNEIVHYSTPDTIELSLELVATN
ncbi:hypothetical protein E2C01_042280 [Portunus trituberculatus]|uniref:Uncharacterized protein n=1 Tax=Portunus trituberculatus TaxID=210409 RepID=A0A5B7FSM9_PORTR|nr:hypothetical protein [Portunus trituberculatus]